MKRASTDRTKTSNSLKSARLVVRHETIRHLTYGEMHLVVGRDGGHVPSEV